MINRWKDEVRAFLQGSAIQKKIQNSTQFTLMKIHWIWNLEADGKVNIKLILALVSLHVLIRGHDYSLCVRVCLFLFCLWKIVILIPPRAPRKSVPVFRWCNAINCMRLLLLVLLLFGIFVATFANLRVIAMAPCECVRAHSFWHPLETQENVSMNPLKSSGFFFSFSFSFEKWV